jgi:ABC transporter substrate binding protein (PQQ-dependent alcohol dehydrogenase system)
MAWSRLLLLLPALILGLGFAPVPVGAQERARVTLAYVGLVDDPRYAALELYAQLELRPAIRPIDGAEVAIRDARLIGRALKLEFALEEIRVATADEAVAAVRRVAGEGARYVLLDLPGPLTAEVAARTEGQPVLLLNVSAEDDALRGADCRAHLLHVAPSRAMLVDALGQYLAEMGWREVLVLAGPLDEDVALARSYADAIQRFGGKVVETRRFADTNDPRQRELNNIRLLTQLARYDVVLVADTKGEVGRTFLYRTVLPRPVVGSVGLVPAAWHWSLERHGAPQLNQRFARRVDGRRRMAPPEYAAWLAVRAVVEAHAKARTADFAAVAAALRGPDLNVDAYKGFPATFRAWDHQLRQPILLHTADATVALAPLARFLHERNRLDTLGVDEPLSTCGR